MEASFWHERWENNQIGFHGSTAHPLLVKHFSALELAEGSRVFLPLCGKTRDIAWLLSQGYAVAGAELSEIAITQLFEELQLSPHITDLGKLKHYQAADIDIFVGDIFDLRAEALGLVHAIYDRAALVALPETLRYHYTQHLREITQCAPQLLICFEYDQQKMEGPPFSIADSEVQRHYHESYRLKRLETVAVSGGLRGKYETVEKVWQLYALSDEGSDTASDLR
jgi:thiopurine S-methyltransferase